jgi:hypothetical protein
MQLQLHIGTLDQVTAWNARISEWLHEGNWSNLYTDGTQFAIIADPRNTPVFAPDPLPPITSAEMSNWTRYTLPDS